MEERNEKAQTMQASSERRAVDDHSSSHEFMIQQTIAPGQSNVTRLNALRFSYTPYQRERHQDNSYREGKDSQRSKTGDREQQTANNASIRPLTVFAICIPLGYTVNWLLKQRDDAVLSAEDGFIKYRLANKETVSSTCSIFTLKPTTSSTIRTDDPEVKGVITSVQFKQPQLQIARNYTLLPLRDGQDPHELSFLIRKERNGEVSGYLHRLPVGSEIELRGLSAEYVLPKQVDAVVFLAGGTGITPAMQVADALAGKAEVHILWANRRREDCEGGRNDTVKDAGRSMNVPGWLNPFGDSTSQNGKSRVGVNSSEKKNMIVAQLDSLKQRSSSESSDSGPHSSSLLVDYYVDEENNFIQAKHVQRLLQSVGGRPPGSKDPPKRLLFVAGPEGFVNHWSAPKQWVGGREVQGRLGGVLSGLDLSGWEVVKL